MALAGFGSLNGRIEIFDIEKKELIGRCTSGCSSFLKWSTDGTKFLTAIIVDKLKVDHAFSIFGVDGKLIKTTKLKVFDLINVDFAFNAEV